MKKRFWKITGVALVIFALVLAGCSSSDSDDSPPAFVSGTNTDIGIAAADLLGTGFTAAEVLSSNPAVATVTIAGSSIAITSISPGSVDIIALDASNNEVKIPVTVNADGSITIATGSIEKYDSSAPPATSWDTVEVANTEAVLGLVGETVTPTGGSVTITAAIVGGKIEISATAAGTEEFTVTNTETASRPAYKAIIEVAATTKGRIIPSVVKYVEPTVSGKTYILTSEKTVFSIIAPNGSGTYTIDSTIYDETLNPPYGDLKPIPK
jgi:hypothetical protein